MSIVADTWHPLWYSMLYEQEGLCKMDIEKCREGFKKYVAGLEEKADKFDELKARLETAERLVLQGGAGHDAIVEKAVELTKQRDALLGTLNNLASEMDEDNIHEEDCDGRDCLICMINNAIALCSK